jgi:hypothetical protein
VWTMDVHCNPLAILGLWKDDERAMSAFISRVGNDNRISSLQLEWRYDTAYGRVDMQPLLASRLVRRLRHMFDRVTITIGVTHPLALVSMDGDMIATESESLLESCRTAKERVWEAAAFCAGELVRGGGQRYMWSTEDDVRSWTGSRAWFRTVEVVACDTRHSVCLVPNSYRRRIDTSR